MDFVGLLGGLGSLLGGIGGLTRGGGQDNSWQFNQQMQLAREQLHFQQQAAQMGIRWRVADAKEAGVHPLYAIGAPSFSPSPVSVNPVPSDGGGGVDLAGSLGQMSQGVARAIAATRSKEEPGMTIDQILQREIQNEHTRASTELMRAQAASIMSRTQRDQVGPAMPGPAPVTAATNEAQVKPNELTSSQGDVPHQAAGPVAPGTQWRIAPDGSVYATTEKNLQMDDFGSPGWGPWMYRNHVLPYVEGMLGRDNQYAAPPKSWLPKGTNYWQKQPDGSWKPIWKEPSNWRRSGHGDWRHRDSTWTGAP